MDMTYISACAQELDSTLAATVEAAASRVGIQGVVAGTLETSTPPGGHRWGSFGRDALTGLPFSDLGETRYIQFSALGTDWTLKSANDRQSVHAAERFAAATQALLAELAHEDLCIAPTRITVVVEPQSVAPQGSDGRVEALPSNDGRLWRVRLSPATANSFPRNFTAELLEALVSILIEASLLPGEDFLAAMERASERGLGQKLSLVRPYDELMAVVSDERYAETGRNRLTPPWDRRRGTLWDSPRLGVARG